MIQQNSKIKAVVGVEHIRYYKNNWGIAEVSVEKIKEGKLFDPENNVIIIKGIMPEISEGNIYTIIAEFVQDPKWGGQYNIISMYTEIEFSEDDIEGKKKFISYLFTPLQVKQMYKTLPDPYETLKQKDYNALTKVKGCGVKNAVYWIDKFHKHLSLTKIYSELNQYNLTNTMVNKLIDTYHSPDVVIDKIKNNPYILCKEIKGIGWKTADKIAMEGGMYKYCPERVSSFVMYYLQNRASEGNDYITSDELLGALLDTLGEDISDEEIYNGMHYKESDIWHNEDKTLIGLRYYYELAQKTANEIVRLRNADSNFIYDNNYMDVIHRLENNQGWEYTSEQIEGVQTILKNNVCVITGGAGTGKSTLVSAILEILKNYSYAQCALSGRASSRMTEITGKTGYTIHRLLGYPNKEQGNKNNFKYHDENKLPFNIIILDEISMVDANLFYYLIRSIPSGSKLIMLGDMGQLESIGSGNIAHDIICSGEIAVVTLTKIQRQANDSAIVTESLKINHGIQIIEENYIGVETRGKLQDLTIDCYSDKSNTFYKIMQKFSEYQSKPDFNIMDIQIIVPMKNRGDSCTYKLNNTIQELYNPADNKKPEITLSYKNGQCYILRQGDKVINTKNNYKTKSQIFNGNIGIIKKVSIDPLEVTVDFLEIGTVLLNDFEVIKNLELGYAITVHKMQGSEFKNVIFGLDNWAMPLLTKELVYTGITRAKKKCDLICQNSALRIATNRTNISTKTTHLKKLIYSTIHHKIIF